MDQRAPNLLDEALGLVDEEKTKPWPLSSRVVLVEDRVETSGAFVLHHLLKRALSPHSSNDVVVFLAFSQPFSHYDRVLRKLVRPLSLSLSLSIIAFANCINQFQLFNHNSFDFGELVGLCVHLLSWV